MTETRTEPKKVGLFSALQTYLTEVRAELKKVVWPTREEATRLTGIVLAITALMSMLLYIFDYIFSEALQILISQFLGL